MKSNGDCKQGVHCRRRGPSLKRVLNRKREAYQGGWRGRVTREVKETIIGPSLNIESICVEEALNAVSTVHGMPVVKLESIESRKSEEGVQCRWS